MVNEIAVLSGWHLLKEGEKYYISLVHYIYLEYLAKKFTTVYLIVPVKSGNNITNLTPINFSNIEVIELPSYSSYIGAVFLFREFYLSIKKLKNVNNFYCRVPDPYCWMPKLLFKKQTIMHHVGDSIEVINTNKQYSFLKKKLLLLFYLPEYLLTLVATKFSHSFSNGHLLPQKLEKYGINITPVISSTLCANDFYKKKLSLKKEINLLFVGYIRHSKGLETLIKMMNILVYEKKLIVYLNLVGDGDAIHMLQQLVNKYNLQSYVIFHGHVNDKVLLNNMYRNNDIFVFPSLSEGSPRVVLEAMANSLPVISTPVGSLPSVFQHGENILFTDFENHKEFSDVVDYIFNNQAKVNKIVKNAFHKVNTSLGRDDFLDKIFEVLSD